MMTRLSVRSRQLALTAAFALAASPVAAQTVELAFSVGAYNPSGEDFENTDTGVGVDGALRLRVTEHFHLAGGAQWNQNAVPFSDDDWSTWSYFVEPRWVLLGDVPLVTPFVGVRGARVQQSVETDAGLRETDGWGYGALAGARIRLGSLVDFEVAVPFYKVSFGDASVDGVITGDSESEGWLNGIRLGFSVEF